MADEQNEWWATGYDELDTLSDGDVGDRHYLKEGQETTLLFLDGDPDDKEKFGRGYGAPFCIREYQIPTLGPDGNTNWRNWATCVRGRKEADGSPMRDFVRELAPDLKPYYVGMFTVVSIPEDVDYTALLKKGEPLPSSCYKILLPAKRKLLKVLRKHADRRQGLRGCVYAIYRASKRAASTGDDWQHEEKLSEEEITKLLPDGADFPFEYAKVLEPLPENEIKGLVNARTKVSSFGSDDRKKDDEGRGRRGRRSRSDRNTRQDNTDDDVPF